jgi:hypothetical protein
MCSHTAGDGARATACAGVTIKPREAGCWRQHARSYQTAAPVVFGLSRRFPAGDSFIALDLEYGSHKGRRKDYGGTIIARTIRRAGRPRCGANPAGAAASYDQNAAAAAGSDELVQTSVALPFSPWMTWTMLS